MPKIEVEDTEYNGLKTAVTEKDSKIKDLETKLAEANKGKPEPKVNEGEDGGEGDDDLLDKTKKAEKAKADSQAKQKSLESALEFNLKLPEFVKTNDKFLPTEIAGIIEASKKENYDSSVQKANNIKASVIKSFFSVQENVDLLTTGQKNNLDNYLGLTKNAREEKAEFIYENIFEPALQMKIKFEKAKELNRSTNGQTDGTDQDKEYANRLMKSSQAAHLGTKGA